VYVSSVAWGDFDNEGLLDFLLEGLSRNRTALNFDILASTNVTLPPTNWINLGTAASLGGGLYRFTDAGATDQPRRFYLLREQ